MAHVAIDVKNLSKRYRIGQPERYRTLRDTLTEAWKAPFRRVRGASSSSQASDSGMIWALKDVSFEVRPGEVMGVIGRNGAGKTTLLKILSRITEPTEGFAAVRGRVGSLLEVGTGFHPELTGRENVFLNGAILGMRTAEIKRKFDEIVAFSEVEKFLDTPVKHYSSGMHVRLAFAVAAHLEPEILLVDEVLAVGDAAFQKKCLGKMGNVASEGRTVLFVSHNMGAIRGWCQRALWLDQGSVMADGEVREVAQSYLGSLSERSFHWVNQDYGLAIEEVVLRNSQGEKTTRFSPGEDLMVEVWFNALQPIERPHLFLVVQGLYGECFASNMLLDGNCPRVLAGRGCVRCRFKAIPLLPERYTIKMGIRASNGKTPIVVPQEVASFDVVADLRRYGFKGERLEALVSKAVHVAIPYEWILPDGSVIPVSLTSLEPASIP